MEKFTFGLNTLISIIAAVLALAGWAYNIQANAARANDVNVTQDAEIQKIKEWQEKANEAIIKIPLQLENLASTVSEIRKDVKNYVSGK